MIIERWEAAEADFRAYYGIDLAPALWGKDRLSWRLIANLASVLPPESAIGRSMTEGVAWTWETEMLTSVVEMLHASMRQAAIIGGAKKHSIPKQLEVSRPWERHIAEVRAQRRRRKIKSANRRAATVEEAMQIMGGLGMGIGR